MTQKLIDYSKDELASRKLDLEEICDVFGSLSINCILIDGVLLGAVRDGDFIAWDWDVELALFEEEVINNTTVILNALHQTPKSFTLISMMRKWISVVSRMSPSLEI